MGFPKMGWWIPGRYLLWNYSPWKIDGWKTILFFWGLANVQELWIRFSRETWQLLEVPVWSTRDEWRIQSFLVSILCLSKSSPQYISGHPEPLSLNPKHMPPRSCGWDVVAFKIWVVSVSWRHGKMSPIEVGQSWQKRLMKFGKVNLMIW